MYEDKAISVNKSLSKINGVIEEDVDNVLKFLYTNVHLVKQNISLIEIFAK